MKSILNYIIKEDTEINNIDDQWINDQKPVQTRDGRQAIIKKVDRSKIPNELIGKVNIKDKLYDYVWDENGICIKAVDQFGNPKKPHQADNLIKA